MLLILRLIVNIIYYLTFKDASNYKILKAPIEKPMISNASVVIKESKSEMITGFSVTKDGLYYSVMKNGVEANVYFLSNSKTTPIKLQLPFTAGDVSLSKKNSESLKYGYLFQDGHLQENGFYIIQ